MAPTDRETQGVDINAQDDAGNDNVEILTWKCDVDPRNPFNWSPRRKWLVAGTALLGTLLVPINGTSITIVAEATNAQFNVSDASFPNSFWTVTSWSLGGAVFVLVFLPLMEDLSMRYGTLIFYFLFLMSIIPQAVAQNFATLIVVRFFSGGCATLIANVISSMIADVWATDKERSVPVSLFILCYLMGNSLGPVVFAAVPQYLSSWRWVFYIQLIVYGALFPVFILLIKETRGSVILKRQAKQIRAETGRPVYAPGELDGPSIWRKAWQSSIRAPYLLFTEPVLFAITIWSAFSFGNVYLFTQSVEVVFRSLYGWEQYSVGYVQGAIVIGEIIGWFATLYGSHIYLQSASRNTEMPGRPIPEARLYVSIFGSFVGTTGGMFVYGWTSYPWCPWIAPAVGLAMVGFGIMTVVTAVADYIVDAYAASGYVASAISACAAGENLVAGVLPLAAMKLYDELGLQWGSTLLALLAFLLSFAPVVFVWKGRTLRERSPFMLSGCQTSEATEEAAPPGSGSPPDVEK